MKRDGIYSLKASETQRKAWLLEQSFPASQHLSDCCWCQLSVLQHFANWHDTGLLAAGSFTDYFTFFSQLMLISTLFPWLSSWVDCCCANFQMAGGLRLYWLGSHWWALLGFLQPNANIGIWIQLCMHLHTYKTFWIVTRNVKSCMCHERISLS